MQYSHCLMTHHPEYVNKINSVIHLNLKSEVESIMKFKKID